MANQTLIWRVHSRYARLKKTMRHIYTHFVSLKKPKHRLPKNSKPIWNQRGRSIDSLQSQVDTRLGQITVSKDAGDPEVAQVGNLAVSGPFRQLGVADYLMAAAEAAAAENGAKILEIELAATETNVIQRYRDWGFVEKPLVILQKSTWRRRTSGGRRGRGVRRYRRGWKSID